MNLDNPVIKLVIEGTQAEFQGQIDKARSLYQMAWKSARDDYEACIAAHYVARHQTNPQDTLRWNEEALVRANAVKDDRVTGFYPSLYVNIGHAYEILGNRSIARRYYKLAADLGLTHPID
jgi:tetratricopeptide (TPR) repeat protein